MAFHVGQKVVCVDDGDAHLAVAGPPVKRGYIYTIADFHKSKQCELYETGLQLWLLERFRPIVERKTDISIFTAMLTPKKETVKA